MTERPVLSQSRAHGDRAARRCPSSCRDPRRELPGGQPGLHAPAGRGRGRALPAVPQPDLHRRLPRSGQHPALHQARRRGRHARRPPSRCSTTTPSPASPAGSARRRRSARASACAGKKGAPGGHRRHRALRRRLGAPAPRSAARHRSAPRAAARVAIVGSGPAGLTAAGELAKAGYEVTIFEAFHARGRRPDLRHPRVPAAQGHRPAGGRPPRGRRRADRDATRSSARPGRSSELRERFDAVFVAVGAGLPVFMNVPGENLKGVYSRQRVPHAGQPHGRVPRRLRDARPARPARGRGRRRQRGHGRGPDRAAPRRRRGHHRLPARPRGAAGTRAKRSTTPSRRASASSSRSAPLEVLGDEHGWVTRPALRADGPRRAGRVRPPAARCRIEGSEFVIDCDMVVVAIGTRSQPAADRAASPTWPSTSGATSSSTSDGMTSLPGVFAGGDIVRGAATVILAMGDGKRAAAAIDALPRGNA